MQTARNYTLNDGYIWKTLRVWHTTLNIGFVCTMLRVIDIGTFSHISKCT